MESFYSFNICIINNVNPSFFLYQLYETYNKS